jgi:hypothetical protein
LLVRIPAFDFGGDIAADWLDGKGGIIESRHYQARDTQFALPILDKAAQVRIYASDSRNGFTAFGTADVSPAAPPPLPPPPVKVAPRLPHAYNPKDDISTLDFDTKKQDGSRPKN